MHSSSNNLPSNLWQMQMSERHREREMGRVKEIDTFMKLATARVIVADTVVATVADTQ